MAHSLVATARVAAKPSISLVQKKPVKRKLNCKLTDSLNNSSSTPSFIASFLGPEGAKLACLNHNCRTVMQKKEEGLRVQLQAFGIALNVSKQFSYGKLKYIYNARKKAERELKKIATYSDELDKAVHIKELSKWYARTYTKDLEYAFVIITKMPRSMARSMEIAFNGLAILDVLISPRYIHRLARMINTYCRNESKKLRKLAIAFTKLHPGHVDTAIVLVNSIDDQRLCDKQNCLAKLVTTIAFKGPKYLEKALDIVNDERNFTLSSDSSFRALCVITDELLKHKLIDLLFDHAQQMPIILRLSNHRVSYMLMQGAIHISDKQALQLSDSCDFLPFSKLKSVNIERLVRYLIKHKRTPIALEALLRIDDISNKDTLLFDIANAALSCKDYSTVDKASAFIKSMTMKFRIQELKVFAGATMLCPARPATALPLPSLQAAPAFARVQLNAPAQQAHWPMAACTMYPATMPESAWPCYPAQTSHAAIAFRSPAVGTWSAAPFWQ